MNDNWLSKEISEIVTSPHISFPKPAGPLQFRMGPGPIDLFSTKFNNVFVLDVKATVAGEEVSREQLKARLLGLQKHWKAEEVRFEDESAGPVRCSLGHRAPADRPHEGFEDCRPFFLWQGPLSVRSVSLTRPVFLPG